MSNRAHNTPQAGQRRSAARKSSGQRTSQRFSDQSEGAVQYEVWLQRFSVNVSLRVRTPASRTSQLVSLQLASVNRSLRKSSGRDIVIIPCQLAIAALTTCCTKSLGKQQLMRRGVWASRRWRHREVSFIPYFPSIDDSASRRHCPSSGDSNESPGTRRTKPDSAGASTRSTRSVPSRPADSRAWPEPGRRARRQ